MILGFLMKKLNTIFDTQFEHTRNGDHVQKMSELKKQPLVIMEGKKVINRSTFRPEWKLWSQVTEIEIS